MKKYKSCKSFPKYKKLINFQLLENIVAWNLVWLVLFFFQAGLIDVFVFKNFLSECCLLISQAGIPRHAWFGF